MKNLLSTYSRSFIATLLTYLSLLLVLFLLFDTGVSKEKNAYVRLVQEYPEIDFTSKRDIELTKIFRNNSELSSPSDTDLDLVSQYLSNPSRYKESNYFDFNFNELFSIAWKSVGFYISFFIICILTIYLSQCFGLIRFSI